MSVPIQWAAYRWSGSVLAMFKISVKTELFSVQHKPFVVCICLLLAVLSNRFVRIDFVIFLAENKSGTMVKVTVL